MQAYNDWMLDEWSAGEGKGRLLPLSIVPLWDAELAAAEVRRTAARGSLGIAFSENPHPLGLPSVHDKGRFWDPLFRACEETGTVVCMHIGSSLEDARHLARRPVHRVEHADVLERHGLDARLHLLRHPRAVPRAS